MSPRRWPPGAPSNAGRGRTVGASCRPWAPARRATWHLVERPVAECDRVVASIFVNPLQFNNPEDLARTPGNPRDIATAAEAGCDMLFSARRRGPLPRHRPAPTTSGRSGCPLGGAQPTRPFPRGGERGGAPVPLRAAGHGLLRGKGPTAAHHHPPCGPPRCAGRTVIVPCPTVREADGLAMSSRNQRLGPEDRAPGHRCCTGPCAPWQTKPSESAWRRRCRPVGMLAADPRSVDLDHLGIAGPDDLRAAGPVGTGVDRGRGPRRRPGGPVRLIDNMDLRPVSRSRPFAARIPGHRP
jgi:hypothetical protein